MFFLNVENWKDLRFFSFVYLWSCVIKGRNSIMRREGGEGWDEKSS